MIYMFRNSSILAVKLLQGKVKFLTFWDFYFKRACFLHELGCGLLTKLAQNESRSNIQLEKDYPSASSHTTYICLYTTYKLYKPTIMFQRNVKCVRVWFLEILELSMWD